MQHPNPDISRYLHEVGKHLRLPRKRKAETLRRLGRDLEDFIDDYDDIADYDVICSHFGAPEEIAASFQSPSAANNRLWVAALIVAALALVLALISFLF